MTDKNHYTIKKVYEIECSCGAIMHEETYKEALERSWLHKQNCNTTKTKKEN